jgi:hypothetical protein
MEESRKPINDEDIKFAEDAIAAVHGFEKSYGGPRFEEDLVLVVRGLVSSNRQMKDTLTAMQKTQQTMQETQGHMLAAIEGKSFGDRQDGLIARTAALERDRVALKRERIRRAAFNTSVFGMVFTIFGRSVYVDFKDQFDAFGHAFFHSLGWR